MFGESLNAIFLSGPSDASSVKAWNAVHAQGLFCSIHTCTHELGNSTHFFPLTGSTQWLKQDCTGGRGGVQWSAHWQKESESLHAGLTQAKGAQQDLAWRFEKATDILIGKEAPEGGAVREQEAKRGMPALFRLSQAKVALQNFA